MGFGLWSYTGVARLAPGVTIADARAEFKSLIADLPRAFPGDLLAIGNAETQLLFTGRTLKAATIGGVERALWILLASVGLVLLVAAANVSNLFLVRSEARQREVAVRRALGAGTLNIARYFLAESALLSAGGGALGLALAWAALRALVAAAPATLPRIGEIRLDAASAAFIGFLCIVVAVVFGAVPGWRATNLAAALTDSGRGNTASRSRHVVRHLLMGAQIAFALVLLVASGLMIRSFEKLRGYDPGFNPASALTFGIGLPERDYRSLDAAVAAHHAIVDRLAALPGVTAAAAASCLPLAGGCFGTTIRIEGREIAPGTAPPLALFRAVSGGYFGAMQMHILRGRGIERADVDRREPIVVVNDVIAKQYFPNEDAIGRRVASNRPPIRAGEPAPLTWLTIVGIVANTPSRALPAGPLGETTPLPQLYMPMSIASGPGMPATSLVGPDIAVMSYIVRTATEPLHLVPLVRREIDAVDRNLAMAQVRTLQETIDRASAQMAFTMVLIVIAASVALVLGVIGVYGAMSYIVALRTGEIGVRLALGAEPRSVARMIVGQGARVALAGVAIGLAVALAGSRVLGSLLYGVTARDPGVFGFTAAILLAVALVACWVPARRAAGLSPVEALRAE
jgi:predicted permease